MMAMVCPSPDKIFLNWPQCERLARQMALHLGVASEQSQGKLDGNPAKVYGVPRGGVYAALLLLTASPHNVTLVERAEDADIIVDDIIDSGKTRDRLRKAYPNKQFAALLPNDVFLPCAGKWVVFPWEQMQKEESPTDNVARILEYIGEDVAREGLAETPDRVVRSWETLYGGYRADVPSLFKVFEQDSSDEMVLLRNIEFYSTCEHHMLPFYGRAHIAYIPKNKVVGISKLARLLDAFSRRLQIQERLCQQVTEALEQYLNPKGTACILEAQHFCMTSRGVQKQNSEMITSSLTGVFKESAVRSELLNLIRG